MKLVACSIVVLAGGVCLGLAANGQGMYSRDAVDVGMFLTVVGGLLFSMEYFRSWKTSRGDNFAAARIEEAKSLPRHFEPPESLADSAS